MTGVGEVTVPDNVLDATVHPGGNIESPHGRVWGPAGRSLPRLWAEADLATTIVHSRVSGV